MSDTIGSDNPYSTDHRLVLRKLAGLVIPPSAEHNIPGADDDEIFARILAFAVPHASHVKTMLDTLGDRAVKRHDASFLELDKDDQINLLKDSASTGLLEMLIHMTATCYYQDGRVLESIDLKSTPPFPGGHEVDQGDWSLLDPVRAREPFYKKV